MAVSLVNVYRADRRAKVSFQSCCGRKLIVYISIVVGLDREYNTAALNPFCDLLRTFLFYAGPYSSKVLSVSETTCIKQNIFSGFVFSQ
jgi:hypothetical protein